MRFSESNIGHYTTQYLWASFVTIQAAIVLSLATRMTIGMQTLEAALLAMVLYRVAGYLYYGWIWDVVKISLNTREGRIRAAKDAMTSGKVQIAQGLDLKNKAYIRAGIRKIQLQYSKFSELPPELRGDPSTLDPKKVLDYAKTHLPMPTSFNESQKWFYAMIGAVVSTYLFIDLSIQTFDAGYLNNPYPTLAWWLAVDVAFFTSLYLILSSKNWKKIKRKAKAVFRKGKGRKASRKDEDSKLKKLASQVKKGCQRFLMRSPKDK